MGLFDMFSRKGMDQYVAEAKEAGITIVDVREADEFASGHVEGAINVPLSVLAEQAPKALPNKDEELYVHCLGGMRSEKACKQLASMGYSKLTNIGGIKDYHGPLA